MRIATRAVLSQPCLFLMYSAHHAQGGLLLSAWCDATRPASSVAPPRMRCACQEERRMETVHVGRECRVGQWAGCWDAVACPPKMDGARHSMRKGAVRGSSAADVTASMAVATACPGLVTRGCCMVFVWASLRKRYGYQRVWRCCCRKERDRATAGV